MLHVPIPAVRRRTPRPRLSAILAAAVLASALSVGAGTAAPSPASAATTPRWSSVETYYLGLVNCTRTGGWVRADGSCAGYGSGHYSKYVAPLKLSAGISNVSRSWARHLTGVNGCYHGDPGARLRAAGFTGWSWGENIGCGSGTDVYASVLATHRMMQAEKSTNGGHWQNMKNARFKVIGIGIWSYAGRIRVVSDFYAP